MFFPPSAFRTEFNRTINEDYIHLCNLKTFRNTFTHKVNECGTVYELALRQLMFHGDSLHEGSSCEARFKRALILSSPTVFPDLEQTTDVFETEPYLVSESKRLTPLQVWF